MISIQEASPINAGGLQICFDKSPDIFKISKLKFSESEHLGFFSGKTLEGFASMGFYNALVKGLEQNVFTFCNFFLLPEARGHRLSELAMKEFFSRAEGKANYGIAVTMKGNRPVESYIGQTNYEWMPPSRVIDDLVVKSILFCFPCKNESEYTVRNAKPEDLHDIVLLLNREHKQRDFGLVYKEDEFETVMNMRGLKIEDYFVATNKKGEIKGVCLAWDCSSFRRTRILKYSPGFYPVLLAYKMMERFFNMAPLPENNGYFREITITDYAVENRNCVLMNALLSDIYCRFRNGKYHFMNFASCKSDPLLKAANNFWHRDIVSHIIFSSFDRKSFNNQVKLPYIDIAFL